MKSSYGDHSTHAPQKEGPFIPRMNDGGILGRFGEPGQRAIDTHGDATGDDTLSAQAIVSRYGILL